jgi:FKBP-type peptidyl-prolyl cis-trans isomerase
MFQRIGPPHASLQVIKAWDRCLLKVSLGSRIKLTVKPAYAYGSTGEGPTCLHSEIASSTA